MDIDAKRQRERDEAERKEQLVKQRQEDPQLLTSKLTPEWQLRRLKEEEAEKKEALRVKNNEAYKQRVYEKATIDRKHGLTIW